MRKGKNQRQATVWVRTASRHYPVWVEAGLLGEAGKRLRELGAGCGKLFVVSSPGIWRLWGSKLAQGLRRGGIRHELLLMSSGEQQKRLVTVERLASELVRRGADRGTWLAALGGGVVGDVTGFLAATYMRGIPYVQLPTTVSAQVDSALGGKTGVNLLAGKNLVGAFHQPLAVLADLATLKTLPKREYRAGLYEVVKHGVLGDPVLFRLLERRMAAVLEQEAGMLRTVLLRAIRVKARIVSEDEREARLRQVLNLGHTFGHALETLTGYRRLRHGEAVGWGMIAATRLAVQTGRLHSAAAERIVAQVRSVGGLPALPRLSPAHVYAQMAADKKKRGAELRFVLPHGIGRVEVVGGIPREEVLASLRHLQSFGRP
jgi:3-dehydroquinate synthase